MKSTITILSLCLCFFWSCQSDTPADSGSEAIEDNSNATTDAPTHIKSEKAAIMVGLWHYAIAVGNSEEAEKYTGRWIEIKRDDTFISGLYLNETNSGTWSYDEEKKYIKLNFKEDEGLSTEWETQGFGETVIWKGSTPNNKTGTQIKMVKQFDGARPGK